MIQALSRIQFPMIQYGDDLSASTRTDFPLSVFRRVRPSKINLLHGYGAFLRYRCYAREQFVVPDKKSGAVNRRDYR